MQFGKAARSGVITLMILLARFAAAGAAGVTVGEVNVADRQVGDIIAIPVEVSGLVPETFAGFRFEFTYDPRVLEFRSAEYGALISMENASYAVPPYTPKLWALRANANSGRVLASGMILMNLNNTQLDLFQQARVSRTSGVLFNLRFRLLQKVESRVGFSEIAGRNLLALDLLQSASSPSTSAPAPLAAGGTYLEEVPPEPPPTPPANSSGGGGGGGCFIATAAFGSGQERHVWTLRLFRDRFLLTNRPGRAFVRFYYRHSPAPAGWIASREWARSAARFLLMPLYGAAYLLINGLAGTAALAAFLAGLILLAVRRRRTAVPAAAAADSRFLGNDGRPAVISR